VFLVIGVVVAGIILVVHFESGESKRGYEAKEIEGREFGKKTDETGCMNEGLARAKGMKAWEVSSNVDNQAFVEECLKSSRPITGFCDNVPSVWKLKDNDLEREQCEKVGMDVFQTGCTAVFHARLSFCRK
jgi:hypothetical protein